MLLNLTKTKFLVGTSSGIFSNTKPTFKSSLPHKKDDQEHLTTAGPFIVGTSSGIFSNPKPTFKSSLPDKKDDEKHGDHCRTQPDQVHSGHIFGQLHKQGGAALAQHDPWKGKTNTGIADPDQRDPNYSSGLGCTFFPRIRIRSRIKLCKLSIRDR